MEKICGKCGARFAAGDAQDLCPSCLASMLAHPTAEPVEELPLQPGDRFHGLEVVALLGRGGMGVVYKARQAGLDRFVALKILPRRLAGDPEFRERFARKAKLLAGLSHPNILAVHDSGIEGDLVFLVMEYVDGLSLRDLLRRQRPSPAEAMAFVRQLCDALEHAHQAGIVHRDIKPENILIDQKGRLKVADFGIAKLLGASAPQKDLTRPDVAIGTPHYIAPEQWEKPKEVDHRADIYALGVVFYELLTGELPLGRFPAPSRKVEIDVRLDEVVLKALEKEPEHRYQRAGDVGKEITRITEHPLAARKPGGRMGWGAELGLFSATLVAAVFSIYFGSKAWGLSRSWVEVDPWIVAGGVASGAVGILLGIPALRGRTYRWATMVEMLFSLLGAVFTVTAGLRSGSFTGPVTPEEAIERIEFSGKTRPIPPTIPRSPIDYWNDPNPRQPSESANLVCLKWLARHQEEDGSWSVTGYVHRCVGDKPCMPNLGTDAYDVAVTGLSLLAFMGAGYSHLAGDEYPDPLRPTVIFALGDIVKRGLDSLISRQAADGAIGSPRFRRHLLNQTFAALALSEAYGMTATERLKDPAQRALDTAFRSQNPDGGWGDVEGVSDSFCSGWVLLLGHSALRAGLSVDRGAMARAELWMDERIDPATSRMGYRKAGKDGTLLAGSEKGTGSTTTLTALGLFGSTFPQESGSSRFFGRSLWRSAAALHLVGPTPVYREQSNDFLDVFLRAAALRRFDGPDGPRWKSWVDDYRKYLVYSQHLPKDGCMSGSWSTTDRWSGVGGRIYATAFNAFGLQLCYNYANTFLIR